MILQLSMNVSLHELFQNEEQKKLFHYLASGQGSSAGAPSVFVKLMHGRFPTR